MINNAVKLDSYEVFSKTFKVELIFSFPISEKTVVDNIKIFDAELSEYIPYSFTMNKEKITLQLVDTDVIPNKDYTLFIEKGIEDIFERRINEVRKFNISFANRLISNFSIINPIRNEVYKDSISISWKENKTEEDLILLNEKLKQSLLDSNSYKDDSAFNIAYEKAKYILSDSARIQISTDPFFTNKLYDIITEDNPMANIALEDKNIQLFVRIRPELVTGDYQVWSDSIPFIFGTIESKLPIYIDETVDEEEKSTTDEIINPILLTKYISDDVTDKIIFRFDADIRRETLKIRVVDMELFENDIPCNITVSNNYKDIIITFEEEVAKTLRNCTIKVFIDNLDNIMMNQKYINKEPFLITFIKHPYYTDIEDVLNLIRETQPALKDVAYNIKNASELASACIEDIDEENPSYFVKQFVRYRAAYESILNFYIAKSSSAGEKGTVGDVSYSTASKVDLKPLLDLLKVEEDKFKDAAINGTMNQYAPPMTAVRSGNSRPQFTDLNLGYSKNVNGLEMTTHTNVPFPNSSNR